MDVTRVCADDLAESVQAAADAVRGLEESVAVLGNECLSHKDRRDEGQRVVDEAARLWGAAQAIAARLGLRPALRESRR